MNKDYNYDYLMHYGVKGMKWGVRHDKPSLGQRYSSWGRSKSNKNFDKKSSNIEQRRKKRSDENFLKNTKYGNWVDKTSNKRYDAKQKRIAEQRAKRNKEFDEFDKFIGNRKGLSPNQKKVLKNIAIGAGIAAGLSISGIAISKGLNAKTISKGRDLAANVLKDSSKSATKTNMMDYLNDVASGKSDPGLDKSVLNSIRKSTGTKGNAQTNMMDYLNDVASGKSDPGLDKSVLNSIRKSSSSGRTVKKAPKTSKPITDQSRRKAWQEYQEAKKWESTLKNDRRNLRRNYKDDPNKILEVEKEYSPFINSAENGVRRTSRKVDQQFMSDNTTYSASYPKKRKIKRISK